MTSCLRNTLNCKGGRETFAVLEGHTLLSQLVDRFAENPEVMCNLARIFRSVDTLHSDPCLVHRDTNEPLHN